VFADGEIEADFTSMGVKRVFRGPAERWVDAVRQTITGFDATQHFFANHSASLDGDRATDIRYMQACHVLGDAHYTVGGHYTGQMVRTAAGWRVARYALTVRFRDGDRRLMGIAYRKAQRREPVPHPRASWSPAAGGSRFGAYGRRHDLGGPPA
jgi:hypothetical protein